MHSESRVFQSTAQRVIATLLVICGAGQFATGDEPGGFASIKGVTKTATGDAIPEVQINAHSAEDKTDHVVVSDASGNYILEKLAPGHYEVTAKKEGFLSPSVAEVQVRAGQAATVDVPLTKSTDGAATAGTAPPGNFFKRFGKAYWDDWHPAPGPSAAAQNRLGVYPAPESNPPYPFITWPMGGTPMIGYPNATAYPLTTALQTGPNGEWWKKANIQIYGWANVGMNISTSHDGPYANAPAAYAQVANTIQLDQATLYIERTPDTVQTDHFDWGFRLTNLYGFDYRFTTAKGYFSQQLLDRPKPNGTIGNKYGYDPVMAYVDLYFPHVAQGMDVRIGRYISLPDIEAQLAPNNYTYSHSLTYTYDCYTQTGINATIKLSNHWTAQFGVSGGCEAAPWAPNAKLTGDVCAAYTWSQGKDNIYVCANSLNDSKYQYNNLAAYYFTYYHQFGKSAWHMAIENWYQYMKDTPNVLNPAASSQLILNANGAACNNAVELTCFAPDYATVLYVNRQIGKKDYISIRNEYFEDLKGQRTGYKSLYSEHMISYNHWIGSTLVFRPELRYEHSYDAHAYDSGHKKSQLMFAGDFILFY